MLLGSGPRIALRKTERWFSVSSLTRVRRGSRPKAAIEEQLAEAPRLSESTDVGSGWNDLLEGRLNPEGSEKRVITHFGAVRYDRDNTPRYHEVIEDAEELSSEHRTSTSRPTSAYWEEKLPQSSTGQPESMYFLDDDLSEPSKSGTFHPPLDHRRSKESSPLKGPPKSTIVAKKKIKLVKDPKPQVADEDLNYFDGLTFKEALARFSTADTERVHTVHPPQLSLHDLTDLNEVDRQYIRPVSDGAKIHDHVPGLKSSDGGVSKSVEHREASPPEQKNQGLSKGPSKKQYRKDDKNEDTGSSIASTQELDFIDTQFFGNTILDPGTTTGAEKNINSTSKSLQEKTLPHKEEDSKEAGGPKKTRQDGRTRNDGYKTRDSLRPRREDSGPPRTSPALDYVRKLRSANQGLSQEVDSVDPVDRIGVGIQARLSDVALSLNNTVQKKKDDSGETELISDTFVHPNKYCPPDINNYTSVEVEELLAGKVLYNDHDIVALWKPYGLPMFPSNSEKSQHSLEKYLPFLSGQLGHRELLELHRIDKTTTGIVLFATTEARRRHLKQLMARREVLKTYYTITNGVPAAREGIINIPISEGKIGSRFRPTIRPDYQAATSIITNKKVHTGKVSPASTEYRVLSSFGSAAMVECLMVSGVKHQIRVHLGLGLNTPILGDNKYSWIDQIGPPQRIKGDILNRLQVKRSQGRYLPIFLHARRVTIPDILPDKRLTITASKPHFFNRMQSKLKLKDMSETSYKPTVNNNHHQARE